MLEAYLCLSQWMSVANLHMGVTLVRVSLEDRVLWIHVPVTNIGDRRNKNGVNLRKGSHSSHNS